MPIQRRQADLPRRSHPDMYPTVAGGMAMGHNMHFSILGRILDTCTTYLDEAKFDNMNTHVPPILMFTIQGFDP